MKPPNPDSRTYRMPRARPRRKIPEDRGEARLLFLREFKTMVNAHCATARFCFRLWALHDRHPENFPDALVEIANKQLHSLNLRWIHLGLRWQPSWERWAKDSKRNSLNRIKCRIVIFSTH